MTIRNALIAIALGFGIWETADILDTGAIAAIFAVLFLACSLWLWRRNSRIAALVLALQFTIEATQAHTWKDASATAKDAAMVLGTAGIAAVLAFLAGSQPPSFTRERLPRPVRRMSPGPGSKPSAPS
jgi:uncharacterized membrane protein